MNKCQEVCLLFDSSSLEADLAIPGGYQREGDSRRKVRRAARSLILPRYISIIKSIKCNCVIARPDILINVANINSKVATFLKTAKMVSTQPPVKQQNYQGWIADTVKRI